MTKAQILVVEDEAIVAVDIQRSLQGLGYAVAATASSGEEAIKKAQERSPDLVLMDIVLKGTINGMEAAEHIRLQLDIPIVYLTAYTDEKTLEQAKITEPFGYLVKPYEDKMLHTTIEMALYKHKMEKKLRESEEWLSTTLKSVGDAVIATDAKGCVRFMNPVAQSLTGWKQEDAEGRALQDIFNIVNEETRERLRDPVAKVIREGLVVGLANHTVLIARDGTERPIDDSGAPIKDARGNILGVVLVFRDVSERREAEEALVRAKETWENTFDAIADCITILDENHRIIRANQAVADAFNTTKESLVGQTCYEILYGRTEPMSSCPLLVTKKTMRPHTIEVTDTDLGRTFICSTSPMLETDGKLVGYTHTRKDITESKRLEARLQYVQKMEAIGTLAGGIAHNVNNLLMGIRGNASLMSFEADDPDIVRERLKKIDELVQSGSELTSQLLGYAREGRYEVKPISLNQLVTDTSTTFGMTKMQVKIHRELAEDLSAVEADHGQIEQVLWNLFINASDAMGGGGELYLKTTNITHEQMRGKPYKPNPGNYVLLTVTDTGTGIDEKIIERIFDPFFTTKGISQGTGLGLASAYGIIKAHRGYIDVESKLGHGSTFSIYLPASERRLQEVLKTASEVIKGTGTVLLVDDEEFVLEVGKELLEAIGYRVLLAREGQEAIDTYDRNQDDIDIVVLDMIMPGVGGGNVYDRMKEINPDVKVLLASGYSIDGEASEILERGCNAFIQKPFTMKDLSRNISEILGKN